MSNAVDILLVDGPHNGVVVCQPKPVPATITHEGSTYTTDTYERVHVAYHDPEDIVADIDELIEARKLVASWDLK
jgi:hypothetical protein